MAIDLSDIPDAVEQKPPSSFAPDSILKNVFTKYPRLSGVNNPQTTKVIFSTPERDSRLQEIGGSDRQLEYFPPNEPGETRFPHPSPGNTVLEIYDKKLKSNPDLLEKAILGDLLHGMKNDPQYGKMRDEFKNNFTPQALAMEKRNGNDLSDSRIDEYIRGYVADDPNDEFVLDYKNGHPVYSKKQIELMDKMKAYVSGKDNQSNPEIDLSDIPDAQSSYVGGVDLSDIPDATSNPIHTPEQLERSPMQRFAAGATSLINQVPHPKFDTNFSANPVDYAPLPASPESIMNLEEAASGVKRKAQEGIGDFVSTPPPDGMSEGAGAMIQQQKALLGGVLGTAVDLAPFTPSEAALFAAIDLGLPMVGGAIAKQFPQIGEFFAKQRSIQISPETQAKVNSWITQIRLALGKQGRFSEADLNAAIKEGRIHPTDLVHMDSDIASSMNADAGAQIATSTAPQEPLSRAVASVHGQDVTYFTPGYGVKQGADGLIQASRALSEKMGVSAPALADAQVSAGKAFSEALEQGSGAIQAYDAANQAFWAGQPIQSIAAKLGVEADPKALTLALADDSGLKSAIPANLAGPQPIATPGPAKAAYQPIDVSHETIPQVGENTLKQMAQQAGADYIGTQETMEGPLAQINDPETGDTFSVPIKDISTESIAEQLKIRNDEWKRKVAAAKSGDEITYFNKKDMFGDIVPEGEKTPLNPASHSKEEEMLQHQVYDAELYPRGTGKRIPVTSLKARMVQIREDRALKIKLQAEAKGARTGFKVGFKEGRDTTKEKLNTKFEAKKSELEEDARAMKEKLTTQLKDQRSALQEDARLTKEQLIQKFREGKQRVDEVTDFIKETLPPEARGKFLTIAQKATTPEGLYKAVWKTLLERETLDRLSEIEAAEAEQEKGMAKLEEAQVKAMFKEGKQNVKDLVSFIRDTLPVDARGKFIAQIQSAENATKQYQAIWKVLLEKERIDRGELVSDIKDLREVKGAVAVDYQKRIAEILSDIDFAKPTERTMQRLTRLKDYLEKNEVPLGIQKPLLKSIERLSKKNITSMGKEDLIELRDTLDHLHKLGRLKAELKNKYNERERIANLNRLIASTQNIDPKITGNDKWDIVKNSTLHGYTDTLHLPRVADMIDGFKEYKGENAKLIKNLNNKENSAKLETQNTIASFLEKARDIKAEWTDEEQAVVALHLYLEQEAIDQVQSVISERGYPSIPKLTPEMRKLVDLIQEVAGKNTDKIRAVYEEIEGKIFEAINKYFPIKYRKDFNLVPSQAIEQHRYRTTQTPQGFTFGRKPGVELPPRTDIFSILEEAVSEQNWYIHMQPELENTKYLVRTPEYAAAAGQHGANWWKDVLDVVARRGWSATAISSPILRAARLNLQQAILGYKITTVLMQPMAIFDALAYATTRFGPQSAHKLMLEFGKTWVNPRYAREFIADSPALTLRKGGEIAIEESLADARKLHRYYRAFKEGGMKAISYADVKTAAGIEHAIYNILKEDGVENPQEEADFLMNIVSGSADVTMRPLILSRGELQRTVFAFQSFFLNRWGLLVHDIGMNGGFKSESYKKKLFAAIGLGILMAGAVAEKEARNKMYELMQGKESKGQGVLGQMLGFIPTQVPFFGNLIEAALGNFGGRSSPPTIKTIEDIFRGGKSMITGKEPATKIKGAMKSTEAAASLSLGFPGTSQIFDFAEGAVNRMSEDDKPKKRKSMKEILKAMRKRAA